MGEAVEILSGGSGDDSLAGDDTYVVDNIADIVKEGVGEGRDIVQSQLT